MNSSHYKLSRWICIYIPKSKPESTYEWRELLLSLYLSNLNKRLQLRERRESAHHRTEESKAVHLDCRMDKLMRNVRTTSLQ